MDYFKSIFDIFTSSRQKKEVIDTVHSWMLDPEHSDMKNKALEDVWKDTGSVPDSSTYHSLLKVYSKAGVKANRHSRRSILWAAGYAATIVLSVAVTVATYYLTRKEYTGIAMVEEYIGTSENRDLVLPDGTIVHVNSESAILYPEEFKGSTRTVYLLGEAAFKVTENPECPFIVRTGDMAVTALGTEFNVSAYPENEDMIASLIEGKVRVECGSDTQSVYEIMPGQQVVYNRVSGNSSVRSGVNMDNVTAWQKGLLVFDDITLSEISRTLQRKFGITFHVASDCNSGDRYTFKFPKDASISEIVEIMKIVTGYTFRLKDDICYVSCK